MSQKTDAYLPNQCPNERVWETTCPNQYTTGGPGLLKYRSYSCTLFFCPYPAKTCRVKQNAEPDMEE